MILSPTFDHRRAVAVAGIFCALLWSPAAVAEAPPAVSANSPEDISAAAPVNPGGESAGAGAAPVVAQDRPADNPESRLIGGRSRDAELGKESSDGGGWGPLQLFGELWPLLAVVGIIVLLFWLARKYLPGVRRLGASQSIKVLARTHLSPRQSVALVRVGRRILVVGQSPENLSALDSISEPQEVSELLGLCQGDGSASVAADFRKTFQEIDQDFAVIEDQATAADAEELRRIRGEVDGLSQKVRRLASLRGR